LTHCAIFIVVLNIVKIIEWENPEITSTFGWGEGKLQIPHFEVPAILQKCCIVLYMLDMTLNWLASQCMFFILVKECVGHIIHHVLLLLSLSALMDWPV